MGPDNPQNTLPPCHCSNRWFSSCALILRPGLKLTVPVQGDKTSGTIRVDNGQPGGFYFFPPHSGKARTLDLPVYFHKRDDFDKSQNRGLDQLKLEHRFCRCLRTRLRAVSVQVDNPAKIFPQPPLLETGPLKTDSSLHIRVVKAQTRVKKALDLTAQIGSAAGNPPGAGHRQFRQYGPDSGAYQQNRR